jgi:hypothetical protein
MVATVALVVLVAAGWLLWPSGQLPAVRGEPAPMTGSGSTLPPFSTVDGTTLSVPDHRQVCERGVRPFTPTSVAIPGVTRRATVLALPRDADGVPGVPPLTTAGRTEFAWDRPPGIRPGQRRGNVLLNAHTWPDGTALGNRLLAGLHEGDRIVVRGRGSSLCYRVTDRVSVPADAPGGRYYDRTGRPQLAIVVCSGTRLGPGEWTERTLWFASPTTR